MNPHHLTIPDDADYRQLLQIAKALGLQVAADGTVSKKPAVVMSEAERQHHLAIIAKGGSGLSIPDPVAWQREIRTDRPLPGRD